LCEYRPGICSKERVKTPLEERFTRRDTATTLEPYTYRSFVTPLLRESPVSSTHSTQYRREVTLRRAGRCSSLAAQPASAFCTHRRRPSIDPSRWDRPL